MSINTKKRKLIPKNKSSKKRTFKKRDFYSGDGFLTSVWGPAQWHILHVISFNYPVNPSNEQKKQYRNYVLSLQNVLPCSACRKNFANNLKTMPLQMSHMKNRESFSRYIYELHELVNKMLKKKSGLTYCDVRERYEHFRARCANTVYKQSVIESLNTKTKTKTNGLEVGCTEPLYGKKARCILNIVPQDHKGDSIQIDKQCIKKRQ